MIRGSLVTNTSEEIEQLLGYLVKFYIHGSVFVGFKRIDYPNGKELMETL
jgi:hypothetical protein